MNPLVVPSKEGRRVGALAWRSDPVVVEAMQDVCLRAYSLASVARAVRDAKGGAEYVRARFKADLLREVETIANVRICDGAHASLARALSDLIDAVLADRRP